MNWFALLYGIFLIVAGVCQIFMTGKNWPITTRWPGLPDGKYTTIADYENDRYVIEDTYGKVVAEFKREAR